MNNQICFATAFYHAEGQAPNIKYSFNSESKFDKYYRCIIVLFASIRRFYPEEKLILFSDRLISENYNNLLEYYNIETIVIPKEEIKYVTSTRIHNKFPGCLFTLDVLSYFENSGLQKVDMLCLLDSDIIMANDITNITKFLLNCESISGISIDYPIEKITNGQSRTSLNRIYNKYNDSNMMQEDFIYFGGEILLLPTSLVSLVSNEISNIVQFIISNRKEYGHDFTEEHIVSLVLNKYLGKTELIDDLIKRIWTADSYTNITGNESIYHLLHLPAEKDKFFLKLFNIILNEKDYLSTLNSSKYKDLVLKPITSYINPSFLDGIRRKMKNLLRQLR